MVIEDDRGLRLRGLHRWLGVTTNNEAEYQALIEGLKAVSDWKPDRLEVFLDSKLVVEQVKGVFKVKDAGLYRRITPNAVNPDGRVNTVALANDLTYFKAQGYVTGKIEVGDVVDDSFAKAAVSKLGPYKRIVASN